MFSVIIPTLWKCDFKNELDKFQQSQFVQEIILIDNDPKNVPEWFNYKNYSKLICIAPYENLFVNPSWNLGVRASKSEHIMLFSDDVVISSCDFLPICDEKLKQENCLIGCSPNCFKLDTTQNIQIVDQHGIRPFGFGCIMMLRKNSYKEIPEMFKIWQGDDLLFHLFKTKNVNGVKLLTNFSLKESKMEMTSKLYQNVCLNDRELYNNNFSIETYLA